nr:MAG TPA: deoxyribosyltransferase [Caudoviricetes sp.]
MTISKFNSAGYYDPTTYEALSKVEREEKAARYRPLVYICSPFSGDVSGNIERAKKYSRYAVDSKAIPIAPHLLFPQFMDDDAERELALFMDMVLLGKCEELWVFGETVTEGMSAEIAKAKRKNMKIRYFTEDWVVSNKL